jgi:3-hydroxyisobutyrate dehydrogenase
MPPPAVHRVAVIGVGRMGTALCGRLVQTGFSVTAWDVRAERAQPALATGARWVTSLGEAVAGTDVLITSLPGAAEVTAVAESLRELLAPGTTWLECSSADPSVATVTGAAAAGRGAAVNDVPLGGGPDTAARGELLAFAGGDPAALAAARPVLDAIARRVLEVGAPGAGYTVKLLVNLLWFGQAVAHAEALALADRAGLDPETVRAAIGHSAAAGAFTEHDAPMLLRGDDLPAFSLARCCEQLAEVVALGTEHGVPMDVAAQVASIHTQALARYGDVDGELLGARLVAERAGVVFDRPV